MQRNAYFLTAFAWFRKEPDTMGIETPMCTGCLFLPNERMEGVSRDISPRRYGEVACKFDVCRLHVAKDPEICFASGIARSSKGESSFLANLRRGFAPSYRE